jgi:hypothetical protein
MPDGLPAFLKELGKFPDLIKEIYGDLAKPGVVQAGKALKSIIGLGNTFLLPITLLNEKASTILKRNMRRYSDELADTPQGNISEVAPEVGVPILEKMAYVSDENLGQLYARLLARASTEEGSAIAHPSFVGIINSLSPDEAIFLQRIIPMKQVPFLDARWVIIGKNEWSSVATLLTFPELSQGLRFPRNVIAYFSNLNGLGLIDIRDDVFIVPSDSYDDLEKHYRPIHEKNPFEPERRRLEYVKGTIEATPFGRMFFAAVSQSTKNKPSGSSANPSHTS